MTVRSQSDPKRGEVWRVDLEPTRGDEMRKTRPAMVMSADTLGKLRLRIVVPITDWKERYATIPWMVALDPEPVSSQLFPYITGPAPMATSCSSSGLDRGNLSPPRDSVGVFCSPTSPCQRRSGALGSVG